MTLPEALDEIIRLVDEEVRLRAAHEAADTALMDAEQQLRQSQRAAVKLMQGAKSVSYKGRLFGSQASQLNANDRWVEIAEAPLLTAYDVGTGPAT